MCLRGVHPHYPHWRLLLVRTAVSSIISGMCFYNIRHYSSYHRSAFCSYSRVVRGVRGRRSSRSSWISPYRRSTNGGKTLLLPLSFSLCVCVWGGVGPMILNGPFQYAGEVAGLGSHTAQRAVSCCSYFILRYTSLCTIIARWIGSVAPLRSSIYIHLWLLVIYSHITQCAFGAESGNNNSTCIARIKTTTFSLGN